MSNVLDSGMRLSKAYIRHHCIYYWSRSGGSMMHGLAAKVLCACFLLGFSSLASAQQPVLYQDAESVYLDMIKEYDQGLYGRAARSAERFLSSYRDPQFKQLLVEADLTRLRSLMRMDDPNIIPKVMAFASTHHPDAVSQKAIMMIGLYAYEQKNYDEAIKHLSLVDSRLLSQPEMSELHFKLGYSLFVRKEFDQAASLFNASRMIRDKYYYPSNYYYAMTQYFAGNYAEAISAYESVAPSTYYKDFIPYYITQIHFNNKDYDNVIGYGNLSLNNPSVQNKTEIRHLIGQAYFEKQDYANALPHLEYVEKNTAKLRPIDFYQLGLTYYHAGRYEEAIPLFLEIRNQQDVQGHYANYYLGQSYLHTGDKISARNSLRNAMQMNEVPSLATEATFHYGRLSAEAGDDVEAIRVLQTIPAASPDYQAAQTTLAQILINTRDFSLAIRELETMTTLTPALKEAYQKVTLFRAEQLIQEGKSEEAGLLLDKSLKNAIDPTFKMRGLFWQGELSHLEKNYHESIQYYKQYFAMPQNAELPVHQQPTVAHYTQGYNYLFIKDYAEAQAHFEAAVTGMKNDPTSTTPLLTNQLLPDALLRAGDVSFKRNQYEKAVQYYDQSITQKHPGSDYAKFQKALIRGLQNKDQEKIALLEEVANGIPQSLWADDALMQAGISYQEDNKPAKAIASFERIVSMKPQSPLLHSALLKLGLLQYNNQQYESALNYYKSVFKYNPDPQTTREAMSAIQEIYVNELNKPAAFFEFAGTIPGYAVSGSEKDSILYASAENHYAQAQYEKAAESFAYYISQQPNGTYVHKARFLRAESLTLAKQWDQALKAYEDIIKDGRSYYLPQALYKAAVIAYNQQADMSRAYKYYSDYIPIAETEEKQFEAILGALRSAFKLNDVRGVFNMAERLLAHSRATDDLRALAHYYTATMALSEKDFDRAIAGYNAVIRINSAELAAESRYSMASIYATKGQIDLAEKLAEESARANVGYPFWVAKSLLLLSTIKYDKGDLLNARAILEAILENFSEDQAIVSEASALLNKVTAEEKNQSRIKENTGNSLELQDPPKKDN